jgi:hypothetical protein
MSVLSNTEILECIAQKSKNSIKWKNNQECILCFECEKITSPKNISMLYKCDSIESYTLYCICTNCIKSHLTKMNVKRNHDKIQAIKKENRNQKAIVKELSDISSTNPYSLPEPKK